MKTLFAFLALTIPAFAQMQPDWSHGACLMDGIYFPARPFGQCIASDRLGFAQTMAPPGLVGVISGLSSSATVTSISPSCPADRTLVMTGSMTFKCAKDLTDPEK